MMPSPRPTLLPHAIFNFLLVKIKMELEGKGFVHVPGPVFRAMLEHFGASVQDLDVVESGGS